MNHLVSILMPLFNAEKWVEESIQSIINQSYENWELIIVDDGSTDDGFEICFFYQTIDGRIKVIQQKNGGASSARNTAFMSAKGYYVKYLDADDLLTSDLILHQVGLLNAVNDPNAIASCSWEKFTKQIGDTKNSMQLIDKSYSKPLNWLTDSWTLGGFGQTSCWLTPMSLIKKAGDWDESISFNDDGEFFSRVLLQASQICYLEFETVYYRMDNPNSLSQSPKTFNRAKSLLKSFRLYNSHLLNHLTSSTVQTALAGNYYKFIYEYNFLYKDLAKDARFQISNLTLADKEIIFKKWFHPIVRYIGFDLFLWIRKWFKV